MIRFLKIAFLFVFFSVFLFLSGCYDEHQPAPVIDAWYQKGAASNFYIVRHEDTIYSVAFAFGLDYRDLVAANHLSPPYIIKPGQRLVMTHRPPNSQPISQASSYQTFRAPIVNTQSSVRFNGRWIWPAKGRLLQTFSRNPAGHPGISIGGYLGEPIRAAASGVVVYSGDGVRGYGNLIIVKQNDSYLSAYAFNRQNLVSVGDHVRAGNIIARMGQNDAERTLLYFEIRRNGVPINPLIFLK
ncbi:MAG TPA: peptidoglycan DD-metalloendopeptidase family protein [Coxiellaceae bacterium]|nr:MAG: hypothetical protein A3E81_03025 [Gammaproteobacteria bacterium RIFCSPHIGHO2_12_FULL_36_30]HLB56288.1 peptidoglycan DD-metalloendopeptidase family protein [Coxiellaceae bacterium]